MITAKWFLIATLALLLISGCAKKEEAEEEPEVTASNVEVQVAK